MDGLLVNLNPQVVLIVFGWTSGLDGRVLEQWMEWKEISNQSGVFVPEIEVGPTL